MRWKLKKLAEAVFFFKEKLRKKWEALNGRPRAGTTCGESGVGNSGRETLAH